MNFYTHCPSPLGQLTLLAHDQGLLGVYFEQHQHFRGLQDAKLNPDAPHLAMAVYQLHEYFAGQRKVFDLQLDLSRGSAFQQKVWLALATIPFATTCSYGELAQRIAAPKAVRALGAANGRNPFSIILPCHRVIASTGALTGYAGGLQRKQMLLEFERNQENRHD